MIHIAEQPEPQDFDERVRRPGLAFLERNPKPVGSEWEEHWNKASDDLYRVYKRTCAYCASPVREGGGREGIRDRSLDHYVAKSVAPLKAYEWSNYRLCRSRLNARKGSESDVLDPFVLREEWFTIEFDRGLRIVPRSGLSDVEIGKVQATIDRLQLNSDNDYVNERIRVVIDYCRGTKSICWIEKNYPFIALEMRRQSFDEVHKARMLEIHGGRGP